jgi:hypothetical protein
MAMKTLLAVVAMAALGGCAVAPPAYYTRVQAPVDPYQWHTVSSEPSGRVEYSSEVYAPAPQARVVYTTEPVYAQAPVYVSQPVYVQQPYYYDPAITFGLGLVVGNWCCGRHWGGYRHGYYRHR